MIGRPKRCRYCQGQLDVKGKCLVCGRLTLPDDTSPVDRGAGHHDKPAP